MLHSARCGGALGRRSAPLARVARHVGAPAPASSTAARGGGAAPPVDDALQGPARVFAASLNIILERYWAESPTAARVVGALYAAPGGWGEGQLFHDHLAFRTFGVPGLGIESLGAALEAFGFSRRDDSVFVNKKLRATWYAPPPLAPGGPPAYDLLPRVFVSELEVPKLSPAAQAVVRRYTDGLASLGPVAAWGAAVAGERPWGPPREEDYEALLAESEYAAWVLANGYALNHTALSVHRLSPPPPGGLPAFNDSLEAAGVALNAEGGAVKASPDGLLLQSSTVADLGEVAFAGGGRRRVARAYLEFVERKPLPQHAHLPAGELPEARRRDGFEAASADNIFASTTLAGRGA
ncbi:MAG: hypothetical protein J3K34DRAFT_400173 [Monoraphidium minutum]|nr:MAG: hypothetical protein J3K34DRAFT_400173 [Monoraphidium minutum]